MKIAPTDRNLRAKGPEVLEPPSFGALPLVGLA